MTGHGIGYHMGTNRFAQMAIVLALIAAILVVASPARAASGVMVSPKTVSTAEGGSAVSYSVVLTSQPTADVTVTVANSDGQATPSPTSLLFTGGASGNWNVAQTVTVSALDDLVAEGVHTGTITNTVSSADPDYDFGAADAVTVNIADNDTAGVTVSPKTVSTAEGGSAGSYTVVLTSQPTADVTVTVANSDGQATPSPTSLLFTGGASGNWNVAQTVTVSALDDLVAEGVHTGTITNTVSSADPDYDFGAADAVTVNIADNDTAGVSIVESSGSTAVSEGGATDTYTVVLDSKPTGTETVTVSDDTQVNVDKPTLTFTVGNWNVPQTVTVSAQNDNLVEGNHTGTVTHSATGGDYNSVSIASVVASIADNNFSVAFEEAASSLFEGDAGTSQASVNVVLNTNARILTAPASVEVALTGGTATSGGDFTFTTPTTVTFPNGSSDGTTLPVTITVNGDGTDEDDETVVLGLQNASVGGSLVAPETHTLTIQNDDVAPGLSVLTALPVEEGPSAELKFTVVLSPASGKAVTVKYTTADGSAIAPGDYTAIATPQTLIFPPGVTSQEVSVLIVDDTLDEAAETVLLQLTDATNTTIAVDSGTGTIVDDDNVDPAITSLSTTNAAGTPSIDFTTGQSMKIAGAFTDPGVADTHTVTVDWGDRTTSTVETVSPIGKRSFSLAHTYASEGFYPIVVTITDADGGTVTGTRFITASGAAVTSGDTVGLVNPRNGIWRLFDAAGSLVTRFYYGNPGDYPFMGDWDGDGIETPGLYRQSDGYVYLRNSNTEGVADIKFFFGNPGDVPIAGDFNGDGFDTVSIYRPSNQTFYIINRLGSNDGGLGAAEVSYVFGNPGDKPFVGDFDGDGIDTVGLHRESTGLVYFRNTHTQGNADNQFIYGDPGDQIVAGDWKGEGIDSPALYRSSDRWFYFRYTNTQGIADFSFYTDQRGWIPVAGLTGV